MKEKRWEILSFYTSVQKSWSYAILFVRYGAWCMYLLVFILGYFFFPFTPPNHSKTENFKKMGKNSWRYEISSFYTSVPKIRVICYTVPEISCETGVIVIFHFGLFLALLPPNSPKNQNFKKMKKIAWRYHHFTQFYQKLWSYAILFLRYGTWQM